MAARLFRRRQRDRSRRVLVGLTLTLVFAGGAGWALGQRSNATAHDLTEERMEARELDKEISAQVNRTLMELWKMEDTEAARNGGRIR